MQGGTTHLGCDALGQLCRGGRFRPVGADRAEQAGEWISVSAGERLVVGVFDTSPRATVVMERGSGEYLMMLPGGAQARFEVRVSTNRNGSEGN